MSATEAGVAVGAVTQIFSSDFYVKAVARYIYEYSYVTGAPSLQNARHGAVDGLYILTKARFIL